MRPYIYENMFQYAKQYIKQKSIYSPEVFKNAPTESNIFPLVIIPQCKIILDEETLKYGERKYEVIFEIEIYVTDKSINNKKVSRTTIIQELEKLIYETFEEHYGLLGGEPTITPNADTNVARETIRFTGKIKNNIIYRR